MLGAGESSLSPYVLAAGHSAVASGLITTVPLFIGALLQNLAPTALARVGSVRTWSVSMAALQAVCLLLLGVGAAFTTLPLWALFGLVSLYWAAGWSVGPAWNTWMDSVIPARLRARFFARRNAFCMLIQWATMMSASGLLLWAQDNDIALGAFCALFVLAGSARLYSASCMARQSEPVPLPADYRVLSFSQSYARVRGNHRARPLIYMLGAQFAMTLAAPFLVPFLKEIRGISYGGVMLCIAAAIFSRALLLPRLGNIARKVGPQRLFRISGLGLAAIPLLWLLPNLNLAGFLVLQAIAGAFLAAYEMAVTLVYLEAVPVGDRTSVLTRFSVLNTSAMLVGSSLGGSFLMLGGGGILSYSALFALAALARLAALRLLNESPTAPESTKRPQENLSHHVVSCQLHEATRACGHSLSKEKTTPLPLP